MNVDYFLTGLPQRFGLSLLVEPREIIGFSWFFTSAVGFPKENQLFFRFSQGNPRFSYQNPRFSRGDP